MLFHASILIFLALGFLGNCFSSDYSVLFNSDMQYGDSGQEVAKEGHPEAMAQLIIDSNASGVMSVCDAVFVGDHTNFGVMDAPKWRQRCTSCCPSTINAQVGIQEWSDFQSKCLAPIVTAFESCSLGKTKHIHLCLGNHEYENRASLFSKESLVEECLEDEADGKLVSGPCCGICYKISCGIVSADSDEACYWFDRGNVRFICLSRYPNKKICKWLKDKALKNISYDKPLVLFSHFSPEDDGADGCAGCCGSKADRRWWSEKEKLNFFRMIYHYNVIAYVVGHHHSTYRKILFLTQDNTAKQMDLYVVGGESFLRFCVNATTETYHPCFYSAERDTDGFWRYRETSIVAPVEPIEFNLDRSGSCWKMCLWSCS
jgi:hypothetical protein